MLSTKSGHAIALPVVATTLFKSDTINHQHMTGHFNDRLSRDSSVVNLIGVCLWQHG